MRVTVNAEQMQPMVALVSRFWREAGDRKCIVSYDWATDGDLETLPVWFKSEIGRVEWSRLRAVALRHRGTLALVTMDRPVVRVIAAARNQRVARDVIDRLLGHWPQAVYNNDDGRIYMRFWYQSPGGSTSSSRRIEVPEWTAVETNYAAAGLSVLMDRTELESARGRLILWHGAPGTGKTYAIRAMAHQWAKWARFEYVIDPEQFLGNGQYMMQVLLDQGHGKPAVIDSVSDTPWRILVLEDAGELIEQDAKQRTGQGLSRLLNLTEGLVGQGLKVALLITTNEKLGDLHPAVSRPGRCLAEIEFKALDRGRASAWLGKDVAKPMTLAELYQHREGVELIRPVKRPALGLSHSP